MIHQDLFKMSTFTENILEFLDYSTTFCELMSVVITLRPEFVISSTPDKTKVTFSYNSIQKEQLNNFKCNVITYFEKKRLVSSLIFKKHHVEILMEWSWIWISPCSKNLSRISDSIVNISKKLKQRRWKRFFAGIKFMVWSVLTRQNFLGMCRYFIVEFDCFCSRRCVEKITQTNCSCQACFLSQLIFSVCTVCLIKKIRTRRRLQNILYSFEKNILQDLFYYQYVSFYTERIFF